MHVCLCMSVCPHDRNKTAKTTITKLAKAYVSPPLVVATHLIFSRKVKGQGGSVTQCKNIFEAAGVSLHSIEWPASCCCFCCC